MWQEARRDSRASKEAFESARARAVGKGRDEIREIYLAELTARGLRAPREDVLDAVLDRITGNPLPAARLAVGQLAQMGKALHELSRIFRAGQLPGPADRGAGLAAISGAGDAAAVFGAQVRSATTTSTPPSTASSRRCSAATTPPCSAGASPLPQRTPTPAPPPRPDDSALSSPRPTPPSTGS